MPDVHSITLYIPCHNMAHTLPRAIESVLAQTRPPDQLLIIDDASTDASRDIIADYRAKHPTLIQPVLLDQNMGIPVVRSIALQHTRCDWVTYLDADDTYEPRKIELETKALRKHPSAGYAYSNFTITNDQLDGARRWYTSEPMPAGDLFDQIVTFGFPGGILPRCELMNTSIVRSIGSYRADIGFYEDYDLQFRLARVCAGAAVAEPTHWYHQHANGVHRAPYARHYDGLRRVYTDHAALISSLPAPRSTKLQLQTQSTLSRFAWRAVRQHARGECSLHRRELLRRARAGVAHKPSSVLLPKNPLRVARGLIRTDAQR